MNDKTDNPIVSSENFSAICLQQAIDDNSIIDCSYISTQLSNYAKSLKPGEMLDATMLLVDITRIYEKFEDGNQPYGPMWQGPDGRSMIPSDIIGLQNEELSKYAVKVENLALKARISDIAWLNDRSKKDMAEVAIQAYVDQVKKHQSGEAKYTFDLESFIDHRLFDLLRRSLQISKAIKGKQEFPRTITDIVEVLKQTAFENEDINSITRVIKLILDFSIQDDLQIADEIEASLSNKTEIDPHWDKMLLEELRRIYRRNNMSDEVRATQLKIAECSIEEARKSEDSSMASVHWLMTAIEELRQAGGDEAKRRVLELRKTLKEKQEDSVFDMKQVSTPIDMTDLLATTKETFFGLSLSAAIKEFALLKLHRDPELRKEDAFKLRQGFIHNLFETSHLDGGGKTIAKSPRRGLGSEKNDDELVDRICRDARFERMLIVNSRILPAIHYITLHSNPRKDCFDVLCINSAFVPVQHREIFSRGFQAFFSGDMLIAGSLLIPQLENSLRYALEGSGYDPSTIESDMTQDYRSISSLLTHDRVALEKLIGKEMTFEIDILFNRRPGPALRHEVAHGKFGEGHFYSDEVTYAAWLIFQIVCSPLLPHWGEFTEIFEGRLGYS